MKLFTSSQIRDIDRYTIENEPVSSSDLMERAAGRLFEWIINRFTKKRRFLILAGPGNNGGDGLVLARLLAVSGYSVEVHSISFSSAVSDDWKTNRDRLRNIKGCRFFSLTTPGEFPITTENDVIVDAIFGSGLSRPPEGLAAEVITLINESRCEVISVDIPSGLPGEDIATAKKECIVKADYTLTFQFPKLSFMFPDSYPFTGEWFALPIALHPDAIRETVSPYVFTDEKDILPLIRKRGRFDHKGNFGHGLLVAGSSDKAGAALLAARAALKTGIGLITCHVPADIIRVIQTGLPEAMIQPDDNPDIITLVKDPGRFSSIGIGPGIGTSAETAPGVKKLLETCSVPIVIDADALNILSMNKDWYQLIRPATILTPHPGEFARLAGESVTGFERLKLQMSMSVKYKWIIVLKGAYTSVSLPDGNVYFNSTGNPGMATAGSGDVLTGIILSLLAQGYGPADAAVAGVYIHGMAGDMALLELPEESIIASDITDNIGNVYIRLKERILNK